MIMLNLQQMQKCIRKHCAVIKLNLRALVEVCYVTSNVHEFRQAISLFAVSVVRKDLTCHIW